MPPSPTNAAAAAVDSNSSDGDGGGGGDAEAGETPRAERKPEGSGGRRQTRRRWRLLQYLLGWVEANAFRGGGGSGGGASAEHDEALAAAAVAMVAVTCPGPPAAEGTGEARRGGGGGGSGGGGGTGGPGSNVPFSRRPFLIDAVNPPCPFTSADAALPGEPKGRGAFAGGYSSGGDGRGTVADGIWGGAFDNVGPFLRRGKTVGPARRGFAAGTADAVWACKGAAGGGSRGGDVDLPAYVRFVASTLRDCGALTLVFRQSFSFDAGDVSAHVLPFFLSRPTCLCGASSAGVTIPGTCFVCVFCFRSA